MGEMTNSKSWATALAAMAALSGSAWPALADPLPAGRAFKDCALCPEMVVIPGGVLIMGSPDSEPGRGANEGPRRRVRIAKFAIGRYETTFDAWDACVAEGFCRAVEDDNGWGRGRRPATRISWRDVTGAETPEAGFLAWMNSKVEGDPYRLPTEAEWEYAARAGTKTAYAFGETIAPTQANFDFNVEGGRTQPVGAYAANAFGLYDMHGNLFELVQDCWHGSYVGAPTDGSAWMAAEGGDCSVAVLRGGSWFYKAAHLRSAERSRISRGERNFDVGFRLAKTLPD